MDTAPVESNPRDKHIMQIDRFMPRHEVSARYQTSFHGSIEDAYSATRRLDMRDSKIVRWLYFLRGLPEAGLTFDGMLRWGFILLADDPPREIVFGLIGRFWTPSAQIQTVTSDAFVAFDQPGFAKVAGNIAFTPQEDGNVCVTTETRVRCLDKASLRYFRLYWSIIGPFSGMIRKEWLRLIKRQAEAYPGRPSSVI
jgi:hypothetical protein